MKQQAGRLVLYFGSILLAGLTTLHGQLSTTSVQSPPNYNSFIPPAVGNTYIDPVFGATVKRVSNAMGSPNAVATGNLTWIENEYSTASAFNTNNSNFILVHQSYFGLYDGNSGSYLRDLPLEINASSEPRWSRQDNVTLYYHYGNQLKSYNISTGVTTLVHAFSQYSTISGKGEMDISLDGDHFVFCGDNRYIFVYQISNDSTHPAFDTAGTSLDSIYITPQNNVVLSWPASGTARFTGQELFDINMNFQRQLSHADGHKHLTVDTNGDEVLIWTNSNDAQPIPNCQNGIVKIRLADATQTCLLQLDWSLAVHITAPDGNGSAFVETYAPANPSPGTSGWVAYTNELLQVSLDGTRVARWAHHRSRPLNSYNYEPKATVSRDGTRLLYASNYDLQVISGDPTEYSDTYLILIAPPSVYIDSPQAGSTLSGVVTVNGWAIDNTSAIGTAISRVRVFVDGASAGDAAYGSSRPDVCAVFPTRSGCPNVGYTYSWNTSGLSAGKHTLTVTATDSDVIPDSGSASVSVTIGSPPPSVFIDTPSAGATVSGTLSISGWALDSTASAGSSIANVKVFLDGVPLGNAAYGIIRPDVCIVYPSRPGCPNVGFNYQLNTATLSRGTHTIMVSATDSDSSPDTGSAVVSFTVAAPLPSVYIDAPANGLTVSGVVAVSGWAIDNSSTVGTAIGSVKIQVDGVPVGTATYGLSRPDVCTVFPGRIGCPNVGYTFSLNTSAFANGLHVVTVSATDTDPTPDTGSATATITINN